MAITIKGIRIESVHLKRDDASGTLHLEQASYALMSSTDKVLANQSIGGYNGLAVSLSPATQKLLAQFTESYKLDVTTVLGLEEA